MKQASGPPSEDGREDPSYGKTQKAGADDVGSAVIRTAGSGSLRGWAGFCAVKHGDVLEEAAPQRQDTPLPKAASDAMEQNAVGDRARADEDPDLQRPS